MHIQIEAPKNALIAVFDGYFKTVVNETTNNVQITRPTFLSMS